MTTPLTVIGNVGSAELKFTPSGAAVLDLSVAVNRRRFDKATQQWEDAGTDWYRANVWGEKAETYAEHLTKGLRVIVVGTLESRSYETSAGEKRTSWEIRATDVGVVPRPANRAPAQAAQNDPWATQGGGTDGSAPF